MTAKGSFIYSAKRKKNPSAIKLIKETDPKAYISINDVKSIVGGFIRSKSTNIISKN